MCWGAILRIMTDVSKIPVPGQTMDVDLSDGEEPVVIPPKKKEPRKKGSGSPSKRQAAEIEGVSLKALKGLFKEQTRELKGSLREELAQAIQASETKLTGVVSQVKTDLETRIQDNDKQLGQVKGLQETLLSRVAALETRGVTPAPGGLVRPPTVLFGGWKVETKRSTILADVAAALDKAEASDLVDQRPWVPRARHSICLSEMKLREGETEVDREQRMLALIARVNDPRVSVRKLASGGTLWATVSRPKTDRGNGSHASKVRRLLRMVAADFDEVDAVYDTGSIWHKDVLVASVDKPRNGAHVRKGKLDASWVDLVALSKTTGKSQDDLESMWQQIMG